MVFLPRHKPFLQRLHFTHSCNCLLYDNVDSFLNSVTALWNSNSTNLFLTSLKFHFPRENSSQTKIHCINDFCILNIFGGELLHGPLESTVIRIGVCFICEGKTTFDNSKIRWTQTISQKIWCYYMQFDEKCISIWLCLDEDGGKTEKSTLSILAICTFLELKWKMKLSSEIYELQTTSTRNKVVVFFRYINFVTFI